MDYINPARSLLILILLIASINSALAATWYVKTGGVGSGGGSWANATASIQIAVDAATNGDEVWVAAGTYTGTAPNVVNIKVGVAVYGGFAGGETARTHRSPMANPTIIDGQNSRRGVYVNATALLDGFIVTRGMVTGGYGAGAYVDGGTVSNCIVAGNTAVFSYFPSPIPSYGGGVCLVSTNFTPPSGLLINCIITGNSAPYSGGGVENLGFYSQIINCTITGNTSNNGGGINNHGNGLISNCIVWGNSTADIVDAGSISYSCFGGASGGNNISLDPLFVSTAGSDPAAWDLRLQPGSPCIDSADGSMAPASDRNGNARYDDPGTVNSGDGSPNYADMGANESVPPGSVVIDVTPDTAPWSFTTGMGQVHSGVGNHTQTGVPAGVISMNWGALPGYIPPTPNPAAQTLSPGTTLTLTGVYSGPFSYQVSFQAPGTPATLTGTTSQTILHGNNCTAVAANPPDRYQFLKWTNNGADYSTSNPLTVRNVTANMNLRAIFAPTFTVTRVDASQPDNTGDGSSWATAKKTIQAAIDTGCSEVWVKAGTYPESIVLCSDQALYGGFSGTESVAIERAMSASLTVIDATELAPDHVVAMSATTNCSIDGFTITGGRADGDGSGGGAPANYYGGGILCSSADQTNLIANCIIQGNGAPGWYPHPEGAGRTGNGGGVAIVGSGSCPVIERCMIQNNVSPNGGGFYIEGANPTIQNCYIYNNTASGYYISVYQTNAGAGGGVDADWYANPVFRNCTIRGNTALDGSHVIYNPFSVVTDPAKGGGIYCGLTSVNLVNVILAENSRYALAGGISSSIITASHCLFFGNTDGDLWEEGTHPAMPCGPMAPSGMTANLSGNPLFVNSTDFHIQNGSAALDRGDLSSAPAIDLDNDPRPGTDNLIDIGADEATPGFSPIPLVYSITFQTDGRAGATLSGAGYTGVASLAQTIALNCESSPITAVAPVGYRFMMWTIGNGINFSNANPLIVQAVEDSTLTANFVVDTGSLIWVKFDYSGTESGTEAAPFNTLAEGIGAVPSGGMIRIYSGSTPAIRITKPLRLEAWYGPVTIGRATGLSAPNDNVSQRSNRKTRAGRNAAGNWMLYRQN